MQQKKLDREKEERNEIVIARMEMPEPLHFNNVIVEPPRWRNLYIRGSPGLERGILISGENCLANVPSSVRK